MAACSLRRQAQPQRRQATDLLRTPIRSVARAPLATSSRSDCPRVKRVAASFDQFHRGGRCQKSLYVTKVVKVRAAIAGNGAAVPTHLNLMDRDAGNCTWTSGLIASVAHPGNAIT